MHACHCLPAATCRQKAAALWDTAASFVSDRVTTPLPQGYRALLQQAAPGLHHHAKASQLVGVRAPQLEEARALPRLCCPSMRAWPDVSCVCAARAHGDGEFEV